jgi:hypothetical protein
MRRATPAGSIATTEHKGQIWGFVQIIDFTTRRYDDVRKVEDEWTAATEGIRTKPRWMIGKDRDRPNHYLEVVEFPSYAEAMSPVGSGIDRLSGGSYARNRFGVRADRRWLDVSEALDVEAAWNRWSAKVVDSTPGNDGPLVPRQRRISPRC